MPDNRNQTPRGNHFAHSNNQTRRAQPNSSYGVQHRATTSNQRNVSNHFTSTSQQSTPRAHARSQAYQSTNTRTISAAARPAQGSNGGGTQPPTRVAQNYPSGYERPKRSKGKRIAAIIASVIALVVIIFGVSGFIMLNDARSILSTVDSLTEQKDTYVEAFKNGDGASIHNATTSIASEISDIHQKTDGIAWQIGSLIPYVGHDVRIGRELITEVDNLVQNALIPASDQLAEVNLSNLMSDGAINVELMQSLVDMLQDVTPVVQESAQTIEDLPTANISKINEKIVKIKDMMGTANSALDAINEIAPYLPGMLGANGQTRNYLLMAQTNSELRSTGGLPGSLGVLSVTDGKMQLGEFQAGAELQRYDTPTFATSEEASLFNGAGTLATSSCIIPDFSRAGFVLGEIWKDQKGGSLDGVIGIDPILLQRLLALTGGFTTSNGTAVNGDNAAALLLHDSYMQMDTSTTDAFFADVADQAFNSVLSNIGNISMPDLLKTIMTAMDERRLQVFMYNADEETVMQKLGCAGTLNLDETAPEIGVYINDNTWSKISWYLSVNTDISEPTANEDGTKTYHVVTTLKNNLDLNTANGLVDYITGYNPSKRSRADMLDIVYITSPAGGSISNMVYTDDSGATKTLEPSTYEDHQIFTQYTAAEGGQSVSFTYDVTVSAKAEKDLTVDTTPTTQEVAGWQ